MLNDRILSRANNRMLNNPHLTFDANIFMLWLKFCREHVF